MLFLLYLGFIKIYNIDPNHIEMKKKIYLQVCAIFVALFVLPLNSQSQDWGGTKPNGFWDHWSINVNAGLTSYFGDLSYYDSDISGKITNESGLAFGALLTKHLNNKLGVTGQLLYGSFSGGNNTNNSFDTRLLEYNLQLRLDFLRLFITSGNPKFGIEGFAGIGQLWFNVAHFEYNEGYPLSNKYVSSSPEFVYFAGLGIHYHVAEKFAVTSSLALRQIQNDRLDNLVKNNDNDFFTYASVGLTYYFSEWKSPSFTRKKGSRIVDSGVRKF